MIQDNQKNFSRLQMLIDAIVIAVTYVLAWMIRFIGPFAYSAVRALAFEEYMFALIFIIPGYLLLYQAFTLYEPLHMQGRRLVLANIIKANVLGLLLIVFSLYMMGESDFSRLTVYIFCVINIFAEWGVRLFIFSMLRKMRKRGLNQKQMILVGYSRAAEGFIDRVNVNPEWGYKIRGILDDHEEWGKEYKGVRVIGKIDDLDTILALNTLDEIAITLSIQEYGKLEKIVAGCEKSGVHTKFIPDYYNFIPTRPFMEDLQGLPVIHIRHVPLTNLLNATMKRTMDLVGGMMALILFSPVMLVTAILIKATSPGPVIFCQERVGLHNKPFKMYKFRSMAVQSAAKEKSQWTTPGDPRVTPIGRFIRKTSIDELPQLFNVLKGDMSLVGPRPERPFFVEKFKEEIPRYMIKHQVRPGMTGWAQVNGYRGDTSITKRIEHDLYYIENWTLGFDFKIMFLTVFKGFINKNAY